VKKDGWKLIKYDTLDGEVHETQLFNLTDNPNEFIAEHKKNNPKLTNLATNPEYAVKLAEMERQKRDDELDELRGRIEANPHRWVGQERVTSRLVPSLSAGGSIEQRPVVLRTFAVGNGESYTEEDQNTPGEIITGVSLTPSGLHEVNRQRAEGWWEGDLGSIYRPKYFVGGVAVHGSGSIPNYPASHGCVRVSVPAMDWIWETGIMPLDTSVWVHDGA
jgi:hypothetical protein